MSASAAMNREPLLSQQSEGERLRELLAERARLRDENASLVVALSRIERGSRDFNAIARRALAKASGGTA